MHAEVTTRARNFGDDDVAFVRAEALRMMGAAEQVFGKRDCPVTVGVGHQIAYYWDKQQNWFAFWPHSPKIESEISESSEREVPSRFIGERVMGKLRDLDQVAYVRFASVYRDFKDINQFLQELRPLLEKGGGQ